MDSSDGEPEFIGLVVLVVDFTLCRNLILIAVVSCSRGTKLVSDFKVCFWLYSNRRDIIKSIVSFLYCARLIARI